MRSELDAEASTKSEQSEPPPPRGPRSAQVRKASIDEIRGDVDTLFSAVEKEHKGLSKRVAALRWAASEDAREEKEAAEKEMKE